MDNIRLDYGVDVDNCDKLTEMTMSIPNGITLFRIVGALCLLPLETTTQITSPFWLVYAFCGITDMTDGYVARILKAETKVGALLDSIADIVFVICCSCKLIHLMKCPIWLWCLVLIIAGIKFINQISAWVVHRRLLFPHTFANKLAGFTLFVSIPLHVCFEMFTPLFLTSVVATFAAVQEGHNIRAK
ncbi:MAG: CDP-alcohol phosphatidyltransferase family protein [Bacteroidaceae bacterium]|nr:CDP-alcohol phosphatidyltransferase family protein [Bacteroidaceae bacterium]